MPVWLTISLLVLVTAQMVYAYVSPRMRSGVRREIERHKPIAIATLRRGERARITGVVAARDALLTSPVGRKACIGFRTSVDSKPSQGAGEIWGPVTRREACGSFTVKDDTGTAIVEGPFRFDVDPDDSAWASFPPTLYTFLEEQGASGAVGDNPMRFQEALLVPGDRVSVLGHVAAVDRIRGSSDEPVLVVDEEDGA